jgi:hypothetical protein
MALHQLFVAQMNSPSSERASGLDVQSREVIALTCPLMGEPNVATAALRPPLQVSETASFSLRKRAIRLGEISLPEGSPRAMVDRIFLSTKGDLVRSPSHTPFTFPEIHWAKGNPAAGFSAGFLFFVGPN